MVGNVNGKVVVLAGTGEYFSLDDLGTGQQNYAYGIFDNDGSVTNITVDDMLKQTVVMSESKQGSNGNERMTFYAISHNALEEGHKGWRLELPEGYVVTSDSGFYGSKNEVATYTATRIDSSSRTNCSVN